MVIHLQRKDNSFINFAPERTSSIYAKLHELALIPLPAPTFLRLRPGINKIRLRLLDNITVKN